MYKISMLHFSTIVGELCPTDEDIDEGLGMFTCVKRRICAGTGCFGLSTGLLSMNKCHVGRPFCNQFKQAVKGIMLCVTVTCRVFWL